MCAANYASLSIVNSQSDFYDSKDLVLSFSLDGFIFSFPDFEKNESILSSHSCLLHSFPACFVIIQPDSSFASIFEFSGFSTSPNAYVNCIRDAACTLVCLCQYLLYVWHFHPYDLSQQDNIVTRKHILSPPAPQLNSNQILSPLRNRFNTWTITLVSF